jgi:osmotically-inducible protein OsmY
MSNQLFAIVLLSLTLMPACSGSQKKTLGLDVDVYVHPSSSDSADILLQAGIDRRLAEAETLRGSIIHVRVVGGVITLTGAVKSDALKRTAQEIAEHTDVKLNGVAIWPEKKVQNQIEVQP